jgi:phosphoribosylformylglycinamidine cyclo-ligase
MRYEDSGVDMNRADRLIDRIRALTSRAEEIGRFAALFELGDVLKAYKDPVLVSSTDGIGTKILVAEQAKHYEGLGQDLVAMCVNDVVTQGARPLFFLDYYATSALDLEVGIRVVEGISEACKAAGCTLIGGETAELPGFFRDGVPFDAAGFVVGVAERTEVPNPKRVEPGNILLALPSSGLHSNGFSLVRKILGDKKIDLNAEFPKRSGVPLWATLLTPTRLYVKPVLELFEHYEIRGAANITGGGIMGNLPRILPEAVDAVIHTSRWEPHPIFRSLQGWGEVPEDEMWRVFNMALGMILILPEDQGEAAVDFLAKMDEPAVLVGTIENGRGEVRLIRYGPA